MMVGAVSGSFATYILGYLGDYCNVDSNPQILGNILGIIVLISYLCSVPFFLKNSDEYSKLIQF